jgi:hypothetical protein
LEPTAGVEIISQKLYIGKKHGVLVSVAAGDSSRFTLFQNLDVREIEILLLTR